MTIEEAREYWCRRLERAEGYFDEHWDAEERHAHADYVDAMAHAIAALAICREHEEVKQPKTNGDRIRQMTDEELAAFIDIYDIEDICRTRCAKTGEARERCMCYGEECKGNILAWLKQEVSEDAKCNT